MGLHEIGVKKSDKIALIAENSYKWCVVDLSIMSLGAITVPGYITSNEEEIFYLLSHSDSSFVSDVSTGTCVLTITVFPLGNTFVSITVFCLQSLHRRRYITFLMSV